VTNTGKKILPSDVIEHWPEVFGDIELNVLPIRYLHTVLVNFKDGKTWEIKVTTKAKREGWVAFQTNLSEICKTYEDSIDNVDFKLDTERVRKDIEKSTQKFLKKKKL
jgi:hypothetical protein